MFSLFILSVSFAFIRIHHICLVFLLSLITTRYCSWKRLAVCFKCVFNFRRAHASFRFGYTVRLKSDVMSYVRHKIYVRFSVAFTISRAKKTAFNISIHISLEIIRDQSSVNLVCHSRAIHIHRLPLFCHFFFFFEIIWWFSVTCVVSLLSIGLAF